MVLGFTGTRIGMTLAQQREVSRVLLWYPGATLHFGDCIGADKEAADYARLMRYRLVAHPGFPANRPYTFPTRAWVPSDEVLPAYPYLMRDRHIVDACQLLIAAPNTAEEVRRSGTWTTVRYAWKQAKPVLLVLPDGTVSDQKGTQL